MITNLPPPSLESVQTHSPAGQEQVTLVVQVNGKVRDRIEVSPDIGADEAQALALASPKIVESLAGQAPKRVISRPPKLVNVVV